MQTIGSGGETVWSTMNNLGQIAQGNVPVGYAPTVVPTGEGMGVLQSPNVANRGGNKNGGVAITEGNTGYTPSPDDKKRATELVSDFKRDNLIVLQSLTKARLIGALVQSGSQMTEKALEKLMPRLLGEVGNLAEQEQKGMTGSGDAWSQIRQKFEGIKSGRLTESNRKVVLSLLGEITNTTIQSLQDQMDASISSQVSIDPVAPVNYYQKALTSAMGGYVKTVEAQNAWLKQSGVSSQYNMNTNTNTNTTESKSVPVSKRTQFSLKALSQGGK